MTNYSKTTNFTAKDSLVSGDANKIVKGSEIDAEFDNIATASATKANTASPTFTGVVSFPDGTAGDPSITNTGDTNTGLFFSAADTLAFSSAGTAQFTMADGAIAPVTDNDVDLGTSSLEFKDGYFDGTLYTDAINLDGTAITSTAAEINILDGVTATAAELNILDGVTSTAAELNILDGVTSTAAELNILDGVTATTAELNYSDTGSAVGTVVASKVVTVDANKDVASFRNITLTGELDAGSLDISGDADIDGTLETDALSINGTAVTATAAELNILDGVTSTAAELNILDGVTSTTAELNILDGVTSTAAELNILDGKAFLDEDDMSSNSATGIASQQSIKAYVDAQITAEDLDFQADSGGALSIDLDSETLTFTGGTGIDTSGSGNAVTFAIDSTVATLTGSQTLTNKSLTAPTLTGTAVVASLDISGDIDVDGTTNLDVVDIDGAVDFASTTAHAGNATFADNAKAIFGADSDLQIYHDGSHSRLVDSGTGNFIIQAGEFRVNTSDDGEAMIKGNENGDVELYFNGAEKLATTSTGIDVTGSVTYSGDLISSTAGTSNFRAGVNAGNSIASGGNYNVVVGDEAGTALTTGDSNVAIGFKALFTEDAHGANVAIGDSALRNLNAGANAYNTAVGHEAGTAVTTGQYNTLLGGLAGDALTTSNNNVAIGYQALTTDTLGTKTVAVGVDALKTQNFTTNTDSYNVAMGYHAGRDITTGVKNTILGGLAGDALTDADFNVAIGYAALTSDTLGSKSVAVGRTALSAQNFTTATEAYNVAVGYDAGAAVSTGVRNTLIGSLAGDAFTDADRNTAIGFAALSTDTLGSKSTAVGSGALFTQNFTTATDVFNTAVGFEAGLLVTTGTENTFVGSNCGDGTDDGRENTAVGSHALSANCGNSNTAMGRFALNVATGGSNTAIGHQAGIAISSGEDNAFVGKNAGDSCTTGSFNTALGKGADVGTGAASGRIAIGINVNTTANDTISVGAGTNKASLTLDGSDTSWAASSDERLKENIVESTAGLSFINDLRPVTYNWKKAKDVPSDLPQYVEGSDDPCLGHEYGTELHGFIAQEVKTVIDNHAEVKDGQAVWKTDETTVQALAPAALIPMLVKAIQELSAEIETLKSGG